MKTLILFAGKYGCTRDCAEYLMGRLGPGTDTMDLKSMGNADLEQYDWIVAGGSIYVGKLQKEVRAFCSRNLKTLLTKKTALFICCTAPEEADRFFKHNFPSPLLEHAVETVNFGGDLRPERMNFLDKKIAAAVSRLEPKKLGILYENIDGLAARIAENRD